jgi:hypothetical protein
VLKFPLLKPKPNNAHITGVNPSPLSSSKAQSQSQILTQDNEYPNTPGESKLHQPAFLSLFPTSLTSQPSVSSCADTAMPGRMKEELGRGGELSSTRDYCMHYDKEPLEEMFFDDIYNVNFSSNNFNNGRLPSPSIMNGRLPSPSIMMMDLNNVASQISTSSFSGPTR